MAVKLSAGDFREKVVFLQPAEVVNEEGGIEQSHQPMINTRAFVKNINQIRAQEAGATALIDAKEFYIRRSADREAIGKDWLMEYRGVNWTLHSIELYEEKFFQIIAKAKGPATVSVGGSSSGGNRPPGYEPGGTVSADYGTLAAVPDGWVSFQVTLSNITSDVYVMCDKDRMIDFGNGPTQYPRGYTIHKANPPAEMTITVWHNHTPTEVAVSTYMDNANIGVYSGVLPNALQHFRIGDNATALPVFPVTLKHAEIGGQINEQQLNDLMAFMIANGVTNGRFTCMTDPKTFPDKAKLKALVLRQFVIQTWWMYDENNVYIGYGWLDGVDPDYGTTTV